MDAPETAEGETADDDGYYIVPDKQGQRAEQQSGNQPDPPALSPPLVLHLDYKGMTNAYTKKYGSAYYDTIEIHKVRFSLEIKRQAAVTSIGPRPE